MTKKQERLRNRVKALEEKMKTITSSKTVSNFPWYCSLRKCEQIARLIWRRKELLNKMFVGTPEEVERMEQFNTLLLELTNKLHARTEILYRKTMSAEYDSNFDNDIDVEGTIKFDINSSDSVKPMSNDDYYGSDFLTILEIVGSLYAKGFLQCEEIEYSYCLLPPSKYRPDMTREELRAVDNLNDGNTWYRSYQPAADKFRHICICHAIHDLSMHKPYSIPDILRMNNFTVEITVKHQHFSNQK